MFIINRYTCTRKQLPNIIKTLQKKNISPIIDNINENKKDHKKNYEITLETIKKFPNNYISIKLSSFNIENNENECVEYVNNLIENARQHNSKILIDAENYKIQEKINIYSDYFIDKYNNNELNVYKTYQMYKINEINKLKYDLSRSYNNNSYLGIKLVRGAYLNEDKEFGEILNSYCETNVNYNNGISFIINYIKNNNLDDKINLMIASHNKESNLLAKQIAEQLKYKNIEYAQLMGMNDKLTEILSKNNNKKNVYKYVPYGKFNESIPYLLRRLYENLDSIKYIAK